MIITVEVMKQILDKIPGEYEIEFENENIKYPISDIVSVDVSGQKIILKS